ncbi:MAG: histidine--tRNA ligase [Candidatus Micrarchaeota archaeon]
MEEKKDAEVLSPARGMRDFMPDEKRLRDGVVETLKRKFEAYAFQPLETPAVERLEVLASKYAGGEEILKEVFKLKDQGGRELGLRYDLTVPLCRLVAANPRMPMPFKRYQIAPVWRDGPLKQGRYREFVQCDVDTVGSESMLADAEILALAADALAGIFGEGKFGIKVSNRKLLAGMLEEAGISEGREAGVMLSLDKLAKVGRQGVLDEMKSKGIPMEQAEQALAFAAAKKLEDLEALLSNPKAKAGISELRDVFSYCEKMGCAGSLEFDASLARGLQYYTGTIFEAYLKDSAIKSSVAGGGRYDDLIGGFAGRGGRICAVGISFGLDVICEALKGKGREARGGDRKRAFIIPVSKEGSREVLEACLAAAAALRKAGVPVGIDLMQRSLAKNMEYASKNGFGQVVLAGESELRQGKYKLRDLATGKERLLGLQDLAKATRAVP